MGHPASYLRIAAVQRHTRGPSSIGAGAGHDNLASMKPHGATAVAAAGLAIATAVNYATFLGWDTTKGQDPETGSVTGPWATWQVVGCVVILLALGLWATRRGPAGLVFVVPLVFTACWTVSAAMLDAGDGLWPIGAALVAIATTIGATFLLILRPDSRPRASLGPR